MSKLVKKVITKKLFQYYENNSKLHLGYIEDKKGRWIINVTIKQVYIVQEP